MGDAGHMMQADLPIRRRDVDSRAGRSGWDPGQPAAPAVSLIGTPDDRNTLAARVPHRSAWVEAGITAFLVSLALLSGLALASDLLGVTDGYGAIDLPLAVVVSGLVGAAVALTVRTKLLPIFELTNRIGESTGAHRPERLDVATDTLEMHDLVTSVDVLLGEIRDLREKEESFVHDASHELRTPIAIARAELDLAQRECHDPDTDAALRSAIEELDRLHQTATDLLVRARDNSLDRENVKPTSLEDVARRAAEIVQRHSPDSGVRLSVSGSGRVPGDAAALERCFVNLLDNAVSHCSATVNVAVSSDEDVVVTITDDGPGLPDELVPRLFERFARADQREDSFGLGTAIAAETVRAHGGTISAANLETGGAELTIHLPALTEGGQRDDPVMGL